MFQKTIIKIINKWRKQAETESWQKICKKRFIINIYSLTYGYDSLLDLWHMINQIITINLPLKAVKTLNGKIRYLHKSLLKGTMTLNNIIWLNGEEPLSTKAQWGPQLLLIHAFHFSSLSPELREKSWWRSDGNIPVPWGEF